MKQLVVTADDFGAAVEVNEAVERGCRDGVLTSASLMVMGPAFADAVERARRLPRLGVGLHVNLVEGRPALPVDQVPALVDRNGEFRQDLPRYGAEIFFSPKARRQLEAEVERQFQLFADTGLKLDHVDSHRHFHLHPTLLGAILKIGPRYGMKAVRIPIEPEKTLHQVEPGARTGVEWVIGPWARLMRARVRAAGVRGNDHMFGLRWTGKMNAARLKGLIDNLPEGLSELYLHPAVSDAHPGAVNGSRYAQEFEALIDPAVVAAAKRPDLQLGGFADFV